MEPRNIVKTVAIIILVLSTLGVFGNLFYILLYFAPGPFSIFIDALSQIGYTINELAVNSAISFVLGILLIIGSIGLLTYKKWARKLTITSIIIVLAFGLINLIYVIVTGKPVLGATFSYILSLIIWGIFIYALSKEKVKKFLHEIK